MTKGKQISGSNGQDFLYGTRFDDTINGRGGDDLVFGRGGDDRIRGNDGFDTLFGEAGEDRMFGGRDNDSLFGGDDRDWLSGDNGTSTVKGADLGSDRLDGGRGNDVLFQSDGNDTLTLGSGRDTINFKWQDPMIALAVGTGRAFATITDFDADDDTLVFDVAGLGSDAVGANFVDGGNGTVGGQAASFFTGAAGASNGESVMVLTETGFATGAAAVAAAQNEAMGDFVVYFNTTVNAASLLFVDGLDAAHSIARFTDIDSLGDLQDADFGAGDFLFA